MTDYEQQEHGSFKDLRTKTKLMKTHTDSIIKIFKVIASCNTMKHLNAARRLVKNYHKQFNRPIPNSMMERIAAKERQIITNP